MGRIGRFFNRSTEKALEDAKEKFVEEVKEGLKEGGPAGRPAARDDGMLMVNDGTNWVITDTSSHSHTITLPTGSGTHTHTINGAASLNGIAVSGALQVQLAMYVKGVNNIFRSCKFYSPTHSTSVALHNGSIDMQRVTAPVYSPSELVEWVENEIICGSNYKAEKPWVPILDGDFEYYSVDTTGIMDIMAYINAFVTQDHIKNGSKAGSIDDLTVIAGPRAFQAVKSSQLSERVTMSPSLNGEYENCLLVLDEGAIDVAITNTISFGDEHSFYRSSTANLGPYTSNMHMADPFDFGFRVNPDATISLVELENA